MATDTKYQMKEGTLRSKIVLFDLDGTLIDSTEAILESFGVAFKTMHKVCPEQEAITSLIGRPLDMMFVELGAQESEVDFYVKAYKEHYQTIHTQKTSLLPNAKEAVEFAYGYARLGIVTTKTSQYSRILLEHFDLLKYFDVVIGREEVQNPKPHPEPIHKALDALGHRFGQVAYMVGDTDMDMIAGDEAEIGCVGVLSGYMSKEQLRDSADFIATDAYEAAKLIEKM